MLEKKLGREGWMEGVMVVGRQGWWMGRSERGRKGGRDIPRERGFPLNYDFPFFGVPVFTLFCISSLHQVPR